MPRRIVLFALFALAAPAVAQTAPPAPPAAPPPVPAVAGQRNDPPAHVTIQVAVFGNDPCPKGEGDEIVVCARLPESERFRIPKRLRDEKAAAKPAEQAWGARALAIDQAGSDQRPNSCSTVGSGGQTGCFDKFMRDARAQREADAAAAATVP